MGHRVQERGTCIELDHSTTFVHLLRLWLHNQINELRYIISGDSNSGRDLLLLNVLGTLNDTES